MTPWFYRRFGCGRLPCRPRLFCAPPGGCSNGPLPKGHGVPHYRTCLGAAMFGSSKAGQKMAQAGWQVILEISTHMKQSSHTCADSSRQSF